LERRLAEAGEPFIQKLRNASACGDSVGHGFGLAADLPVGALEFLHFQTNLFHSRDLWGTSFLRRQVGLLLLY